MDMGFLYINFCHAGPRRPAAATPPPPRGVTPTTPPPPPSPDPWQTMLHHTRLSQVITF